MRLVRNYIDAAPVRAARQIGAWVGYIAYWPITYVSVATAAVVFVFISGGIMAKPDTTWHTVSGAIFIPLLCLLIYAIYLAVNHPRPKRK